MLITVPQQDIFKCLVSPHPKDIHFKGIVRFFFKWGHIKYISIVDLFPTIITDQRSFSLEK